MFRINVSGLMIYLVLFGGWGFGFDVLLTLGVAWVLHTNPILVTWKTKAYRQAEQALDKEIQAALLANQIEDMSNLFGRRDPKSIN
jgi:hypothetical protein